MLKPNSKVRLITRGKPSLPELGSIGVIEQIDPTDNELDVKVDWGTSYLMPWVNHSWIELVEEQQEIGAVGTAVLHCRLCSKTEFKFKDNEGWYVCANCGAIHDKDEVFSNLQLDFE